MFDILAVPRKFGQAVQAITALRATFNESLAVGQVEGEGDEMTRAGLRYSFGFLSTVTGIAPVAALPTTAAQWLLWNPAANPNTIFLDVLGVALVSGTGAATPAIWVGGRKVFSSGSLSTIATPPTTSATGMVTTNAGVQPASASQLIIASAQTIVAGSPIESAAEYNNNAVASPAVLTSIAINRDLKGKLSLPPGTGYALTVFATSGTANLYAPFGSYREYQTLNQ
jgi:hypothetical protein